MRNERQNAINRLREQQQNRHPFFDDWERDFDKSAKRMFRWGVGVWVGVLLANLVIWGVVIWAIIQLVQWVTSK